MAKPAKALKPLNWTRDPEDAKSAAELRALEKELEALDGDVTIASDTPSQRVSVPMEALILADNQRAKNKYDLEVAREQRDKEAIKRLAADKVNLMKRLAIHLRRVVSALAEEDEVRLEISNWRSIPVNLRPVIGAHLKRLHGVSVDTLLARVAEIEEDQRLLRQLTGDANDEG